MENIQSVNSESKSENDFPFTGKPLSSLGPHTVVNPERRPSAAEDSTMTRLAPVDSALAQRLFPPYQGPEAVESADVQGINLGHYRLEKRIGLGGMGAVYKAVDERLDRIVALKVLSPQNTNDQAAIRRFQNEARAGARLDHDHIARVYHFDTDQGLHFIAFEFVEGKNIREMIRERRRIEPAEALNYILQIATALKHTSNCKVIHRDIKPSNIIITRGGRAKLVDLGLARKEQTESQGELTMAGTTLGTFDYISPEQARDPRNVDVRSDIYSLGCTFYHMLTGEPPYPEGTMLQKLLDHQGKTQPDAALKNRKVPKVLSTIIQKMMASEPSDRYSTPDALLHELMMVARPLGVHRFVSDSMTWITPTYPQQPFWYKHLGLVATVALLLITVFAIDHFSNTSAVIDPAITSTPEKNETNPALITSKQPPEESNSTDENSSNTNDDNSIVVRTDKIGSPDQNLVETMFPQNTRLFDDPELPIISPAAKGPDLAGLESKNSPDSSTPTPDKSITPIEAQQPESPDPKSEPTEKPATLTGQGVALLAAGSQKPKFFRSLEAACAAAEDGNVIELRYDGQLSGLPEKPLRIQNKRITIRAAAGFRPVILFAPAEQFSSGTESQMMNVLGGSLDMINVDLILDLTDVQSSKDWALFSLQGFERVRLQGVTISIANNNNQRVAVMELSAPPGGSLDKMGMRKNGQESTFELKINESFVSGYCNLFTVLHSEPGRIELENSLISLSGSTWKLIGDLETPKQNSAELILRMEHVTSYTENSLIEVETGDIPREILPINVQVLNSILASSRDVPMIKMTGNVDTADFSQLLSWHGERNSFRFKTYWQIESLLDLMEPVSRNIDNWLQYWSATDQGSVVDAYTGIIPWKQSLSKKPAQCTIADFELSRDERTSPILNGATDGSDLGADLTRLPAERKQTENKTVELTPEPVNEYDEAESFDSTEEIK